MYFLPVYPIHDKNKSDTLIDMALIIVLPQLANENT